MIPHSANMHQSDEVCASTTLHPAFPRPAFPWWVHLQLLTLPSHPCLILAPLLSASLPLQTVEQSPAHREELLANKGRIQVEREQAMEELKRSASTEEEKEALVRLEVKLKKLRQAEDKPVHQLEEKAGHVEAKELFSEAQVALEQARAKAKKEAENQKAYLEERLEQLRAEYESRVGEKEELLSHLHAAVRDAATVPVQLSPFVNAIPCLANLVRPDCAEQNRLLHEIEKKDGEIENYRREIEKCNWEIAKRHGEREMSDIRYDRLIQLISILGIHLTRVRKDVKLLMGMAALQLKAITFLAQGETDCPQLIVLTPAKKTKVRFDPRSWMSKEMELNFLCASSLEPIEPSVKINLLKDEVKAVWCKVAPALKFSMQAIKMILAFPHIDLGPLDSFLSERFNFDMTAVTDQVQSMTEKVESMEVGIHKLVQAAMGDENADSLGTLDEVIKALEPEDLDAAQRDKIQEIQQLSGPAFKAITELAREQKVQLKLPMKKMMALDGTVAWVHEKHAEKWAQSGRVWTEVSIKRSPLDEDRVLQLEDLVRQLREQNEQLTYDGDLAI